MTVTELRVHGVHGAPPADVLDRPLVTRVAGDADAGFWRPRPDYPGAPGPGGTTLEAYGWGNLTSGSAARALWLLLLPFTFANTATWMRPACGPRLARAIGAVGRLYALSLTATFVLSVSGVGLDLLAWQCAGPGRACAGHVPFGGFFAPTGRRLAIGALLPAAAIGLLWFLARRTWQRYESYPPAGTARDEGLANPRFWNGRQPVGRLRTLHVAVAYAVLAAVLAGPLAWRDRTAVAWTLAGLVGLILLAGTVTVLLPGLVRRDDPPGWAEPTVAVLRLAALVACAATVLYALLPRPDWPTAGELPGFAGTVTWLLAGQVVVLGVIAVLILFAPRPAERPLLGGFGQPVLASLGLGLAAAFSAGLSFTVAALVGGLSPPPSFGWASLGFLFAVVVTGLVAAIGVPVRLARLRRAAAAVTDADFPGRRAGRPDRAAAIDAAIADARLSGGAATLFMIAYLPVLVAALVATGLAFASVNPIRLGPVWHALTMLGTWLIAAATLGLVLLGWLAYRSPGVRRIVGVLWDLGTFWPRAAHPLAPPCYAERVVPELVTRATWLAAGTSDRTGLVLSGHSQGSVLSAAAVLLLPAGARRFTGLLTHGCPLHRLYARLFPAYVHDALLDTLATQVRWINLWRDTDPLGGPVHADDSDWRLRDPVSFDPQPGDTVDTPIRGHAAYAADPAYAAAVTELATNPVAL